MNPNVKEITKKDPVKAVCQYCHSSHISPMQWGPMYQLQGITVHYFCLLFSAGLNQEGEDEEGILGFMPADIRKEIKRGDRLKCKYCRRPNATIGCWNKSCNFSYHYPCGLRNGCSFEFIGNFASYCPKHKEVFEAPPSIEDDCCPICMCDIDSKQDSVVWPPCCKKGSFFHKRCMMEMGRNHGIHYFKCPLCNDKETFSVAMRKMGVYLPDRDAAWETVPNAFVEQTQRYRRCDADKCLCPKGREHSSVKDCKPWKIIRCGGCGASAIHKYCGKLKNLTWRCVTCADVLLNKKKSGELPSSSRIQREEQFPTPSSSTTTTASDEPDIASSSKGAKGVQSDDDDADEDASSSGSTPVPPSCISSLTSDSTDVSFTARARERFFDPRYGVTFVDDPAEDTESTEDEVEDEDDDNIFISPESRLHQQIYGGPPKEIDATPALRRCTEKVNYSDPVLPDPLFASASPLLLAQYIPLPPPPLSTSSQTSQSESVCSSIQESTASSVSKSNAVSAEVPLSVQDTPDDSTSSEAPPHPGKAASSMSEPEQMTTELTPPHTPSSPTASSAQILLSTTTTPVPMAMDVEADKLQEIENHKPEDTMAEPEGVDQLSSEAVPQSDIISEEEEGEDDDMGILILDCFSLVPGPGSGSIEGTAAAKKEEGDKDDHTLPGSASVPTQPRPDPQNKLNNVNDHDQHSGNDETEAEIKIVKVHEPEWPTVDIGDTVEDEVSDAEQGEDNGDANNEEDSGSDTDRVEDIAGGSDDNSDIQPIAKDNVPDDGDDEKDPDSDSDIEILTPERPAILDLVNRKVQGKQNHLAASSSAPVVPLPVPVASQVPLNAQQKDYMSFLNMIQMTRDKMQTKKPENPRAGPGPAVEPELICLDSDEDGEDKNCVLTVASNIPEPDCGPGHSGKRKRNEVED